MAALCPRCRKLISPDETRCPYCGLARPNAPWRRYLGGGPLLSPDRIVRDIVVVNAVMFALSLVIAPSRHGAGLNPLALLSPSDQSLLLLGASGTVPIVRLHRWWTLLSANYLHGGLLHIFFNMAALYQVGPFVVREYGVHRMFVIYTLGGIAGFLVSFLAGVPFTIGASAALLALIGAAMYYGRHRGGWYGQNVFRQLLGWAAGIFVFGLLFPGINNWAHGGGLAAGFLLGSVLGYRERRPEQPVHRALATVCLAATGLCLAWAVLSAVWLRFVA